MTPPKDVAALLDAMPIGTSRGTAHGKHYVATRSLFNDGRSTKVVAEELGGTDYVSLNFYDLTNGPALFPCEMSADKAIAFLRSYAPDAASDATG